MPGPWRVRCLVRWILGQVLSVTMPVPESNGVTRIWSDEPDVMLPPIATLEMLDLDRNPAIGSELLLAGWEWFWGELEVVDGDVCDCEAA